MTNSLYVRGLTVGSHGFSAGVPFQSNGHVYIPVGSKKYVLAGEIPSNRSGVVSVLKAERANENSSWELSLSTRFSETATSVLLVLWVRAPKNILSNEQAIVLEHSVVGGVPIALVSLIPGGVVRGSDDSQFLHNNGDQLVINGVPISLIQGASASC